MPCTAVLTGQYLCVCVCHSLCTQEDVSKNIGQGASGMSNFSVQLKIIAAVKAASDEIDPTAENQLITCATGVADSLVVSLDSVMSSVLTH